MNDSLPFKVDSLKKPFHLALMRSPSRLHGTVLKLNEAIIAAHLGVYDRKTIHLGVFAYSPVHSQYSPGKLLLLLLAESMNRDGFSTLDLTPGGDWKDRFSSNHDEVYLLRVFLGRRELIKYHVISKCEKLAKSGIQRIGIKPRSLSETFRELRRIGAKRYVAGVVECVFRFSRTLLSHPDLRLYILDVDQFDNHRRPDLMAKDSIRDLLAFEPCQGRDSRQDFLSRALRWLEQGRHIYTRVEAGKLIHYGCLIERQQTIFLPQVQQELSLSPASAVVLDFYTDPRARGRGLCQRSLEQMVRDTVAQNGIKEIVTFDVADNLPFRRAIEKTGFRYRDTVPIQNAFRKL